MLGCARRLGSRCGKICWGVGRNMGKCAAVWGEVRSEGKCWEECGEVHRGVQGDVGRGVLGGLQ